MPKRGRNSFKFQGEGVQNPEGTVSTRWVPHTPRNAAQGQPAIGLITCLVQQE